MIRNANLKLQFFSLFLLAVFMTVAIGCSKDYQIPHEELTQDVEEAMILITSQALIITAEENPELNENLLTYVRVASEIGALYIDGEASGGDMAQTLSTLLVELNDALDFVEEGSTLEGLKLAMNLLTGFANSLITAQEIPESAQPYLEAVVKGIIKGMDKYIDHGA